MWIATNVGFISIVQDKKDAQVLKVRARARAHLEALFPGVAILETEDTDYRFRVITDRPTVALLLADLVMAEGDRPGSVKYDNFKNSVKDNPLHDLYSDFWSLHHRYQYETLRRVAPANKRNLALNPRAKKKVVAGCS